MAYNNNRKNWHNDPKPELPEDYLKGGYYRQENGELTLDKKYIVGYPSDLADKLSNEGNSLNKRSQIRKFYEYALRMQQALKQNDGNFSRIEAELHRLGPHAAYAKSRKVVSEFFEEFINQNLAAIHTADDLTAFCKHFEAIIAYLPKDN